MAKKKKKRGSIKIDLLSRIALHVDDELLDLGKYAWSLFSANNPAQASIVASVLITMHKIHNLRQLPQMQLINFDELLDQISFEQLQLAIVTPFTTGEPEVLLDVLEGNMTLTGIDNATAVYGLAITYLILMRHKTSIKRNDITKAKELVLNYFKVNKNAQQETS